MYALTVLKQPFRQRSLQAGRYTQDFALRNLPVKKILSMCHLPSSPFSLFLYVLSCHKQLYRDPCHGSVEPPFATNNTRLVMLTSARLSASLLLSPSSPALIITLGLSLLHRFSGIALRFQRLSRYPLAA